MSSYSLKITNNSGASQNIAIYQSHPNADAGLPLVWVSKAIHNTNHNTFEWDINWQLNWGTSAQKLIPGVMWTSGGSPVDVNPVSAGGINQIGITYFNDDFSTNSKIHNNAVPQGTVKAVTDTSFTVAESEKMSIAIYMDNKPALAMQGKPNGSYLYHTHPTYYLCVTDVKEGTAVSSEFVNSPTPVVYQDGQTALSYELTETLTFERTPE